MIRFRPWVLRVEPFRVLDLSLSLAGWHEYFSAALGLLDDVLSLLLLALLWHAVLEKSLKIIIFIGLVLAWQERYLRETQLLLYLCGLLQVS